MVSKVYLLKSNLEFILCKYPECVKSAEVGIEATEKVPFKNEQQLALMLKSQHHRLTNNLLRAKSKCPDNKLSIKELRNQFEHSTKMTQWMNKVMIGPMMAPFKTATAKVDDKQ